MQQGLVVLVEVTDDLARAIGLFAFHPHSDCAWQFAQLLVGATAEVDDRSPALCWYDANASVIWEPQRFFNVSLEGGSLTVPDSR